LDIFILKDNVRNLIQSFQEKKQLNYFKSQLNVHFKSAKCVYAYFNQHTGFIEAYGYGQAVHCFGQALENLQMNRKQETNKILSVDFDVSQYPLLEVFSKFSGYYFSDFEKKIGRLSGKVVLKDAQGSITVDSSNEPGAGWRKEVEKFVKDYLNQFESGIELDMPFSRESKEAKGFLYDVNSIEAVWQAECNRLALTGAKKSIESFINQLNI